MNFVSKSFTLKASFVHKGNKTKVQQINISSGIANGSVVKEELYIYIYIYIYTYIYIISDHQLYIYIYIYKRTSGVPSVGVAIELLW